MSDLLAKYGVSAPNTVQNTPVSGGDLLAKYGVTAPVAETATPSAPIEEPIHGKGGLIKALIPGSMEEMKNRLKVMANTVGMGYLPQVSGALQTGSVSSPEYVKARDAEVAALDALPTKTKAMGTAAGVGIPLLLSGGLSGGAQALAKAPSIWAQIAKMVGTGAVMGAAANPGDKPGELNPLQLGPRAKNAAISAAISAPLAALSVAPQAVEKLRDFAQTRALKQSGAKLKDFMDLRKAGKKASTGQMALDEGIVTPGATPEKIAERADAHINHYNDVKEGIENVLDSQVANAPLKVRQHLPNPHKLANEIEAYATQLEKSPATAPFAKQARIWAEGYKAMPNKPMSLSEIHQQKKSFDELIEWGKRDPSMPEVVARKVRGLINKSSEDAVEAISKVEKVPQFDTWKKAKDQIGKAKDIHKMAVKDIDRMDANNSVTLTDLLVGLGGTVATSAGHGNIGVKELLAGAAAAAAHHGAKRYGNALAATGANKAANILSKPGVQQAGEMAQANLWKALLLGNGAAAGGQR